MLLIYYLYVWLVDDIVIMLFFKGEEEYDGFQIVIEVIRREIEIMKFK